MQAPPKGGAFSNSNLQTDDMITITEFCARHRACPEGRRWALANCRDMQEAWGNAQPEWVVWIATRPGVLDDRTLRKFAAWSARQVQHLMTDPRSTHALDVAERHADGLATDDELFAACDAACTAAWAAEGDAAGAAAWAAVRAALLDCGRYAVRDALWDGEPETKAAWLRENATPNWEGA